MGRSRRAAKLPSFIHIGPPKTATTWLYFVLLGRANLPWPIKETNFFSHNYYKGMEWYLAKFQNAVSGLPFGECGPDYFVWPETTERIKALIPDAKIICTLRDPVGRMLSYYRFLARYAAFDWTFEEAVEKDEYMRNTSRYGTHVRRWQSAFGRENVLVTFYDDLLADPQVFLDDICDFTGIARFALGKQRERVMTGERHRMPARPALTHFASAVSYRVQKLGLHGLVEMLRRAGVGRLFYDNGSPFPPLSNETDQRLRAELRSEIEELELTVGRDLSSWKNGVRTHAPYHVSAQHNGSDGANGSQIPTTRET